MFCVGGRGEIRERERRVAEMETKSEIKERGSKVIVLKKDIIVKEINMIITIIIINKLYRRFSLDLYSTRSIHLAEESMDSSYQL